MLKTDLPFDPGIPLLRIYSKKKVINIYIKIQKEVLNMFTVAT